MNFARGLAACAAPLLLVACAAFTVERQPPAPAFDILGRMLVSNEGRAFSSNFRWRHVADNDEIWLMSPVGQTLAYIVADDTGATLKSADQQEYQARSVESLTRRVLGWPLPLDHLQYWIAGTTAPGTAAVMVGRDEQGRLEALEQHGWHIRYAYPEPGAGGQPRRLDMAQQGQQIRIVIDQWRGGVGP